MNVTLPFNARPHHRGFAGETPLQWYGTANPPGYAQAYAVAVANGYSVPFNAEPALTGAGVDYVNPDGTVDRILDWQVWPLPVSKAALGTANTGYCASHGCTWDPSFVSPPQAVWNQYMVQLGVQTIAQQQAAAVAAATAQAQTNCSEVGGTWDAATSSCTPPASAPATLSAQQACLAAGKTWNGSTNSCNAVQPTATPPPASTGTSPAKLTFTMPRTPAQVGDQWTLKITGAPANASVTVYGVHPDGSTATQAMGQTESDGSFTLSGTFDTTVEGTWQETWYVGTQQVGTPFSFTVAIPAGSQGSGSPSGGGIPGGTGGTGGTGLPATILGVNSTYLIGGAVGLLVLVMLMGGRR